MFYEVLIVVYLIVAIMLIGFVLIQQGKGADMGASFGSGEVPVLDEPAQSTAAPVESDVPVTTSDAPASDVPQS